MIRQKVCPQWLVPERPVEADPRSRMADPTDPDHPPIPPDDLSAHAWMEHPGGMHGSHHWGQYGVLGSIEFPDWLNYLPRDEDGIVELGQDDVMPIALINSRAYQDEVESVYRQALILSFERFEFDINWFAGTDTFFNAFGRGDPPGAFRRLSVDNQFGFTKNLAAGGQILVDFANRFVWEFAGGQVSAASSSMLFRLTQPVLRGAFRDVRLEALTQAERNLLYQIRQYARFRREFYVDTVGQNGFLGLLALVQGIRNQRANLESLQRNLEELEALFEAEIVRQINVDQVYQQYEQGRLGLLSATQALEAALDSYKIQLGLPPQLEVKVDERALAPFELNDSRFPEFEARNEQLRLDILRYDAGEIPPVEDMRALILELVDDFQPLPPLAEKVTDELRQWQEILEEQKELDLSEANRQDLDRRIELADRIDFTLEDVSASIQDDQQRLERLLGTLGEVPLEDTWEELREIAGESYRERVSDLFVSQTQVRVFLIRVEPVTIDQDTALDLAFSNRLDLMNARGRVIDSYRRVEVAADALEGDLDFTVEAELGTDPSEVNPIRFDASANRYRAGVEFDSPVNRLAERNAYRAAQIDYQRARRTFMAARDVIALQVRSDLRRLEFEQFQFEVTRQQLITAARQVEEAQFNLRSSQTADSSLTRDLLTALQQLLSAKNNLIRSWVSYETARMNLFRDLGMLEVDSEGVWVNERDGFNFDGQDNATDDFAGSEAAGDTEEIPRPAPLPGEINFDLQLEPVN